MLKMWLKKKRDMHASLSATCWKLARAYGGYSRNTVEFAMGYHWLKAGKTHDRLERLYGALYAVLSKA